MLKQPLPWQSHAWQQLFSTPAGWPHALLVYGPKGIGKFHFTQLAAQALLCERPGRNFFPCGSCTSCYWCGQETHPDLKLLQPESLSQDDGEVRSGEDRGTRRPRQGGKQISVGQVRELTGFMDLTAQCGGRKVVVVHPTEDLGVSAANALLKTLEEPPRETTFLLVSHRPHRIPPTVRSRCRLLPMHAPQANEGIAWLAEQGVAEPLLVLSEAGFAPLRARDHSQGDYLKRRKDFLGRLADDTLDPIEQAATLDLTDLPEILGWLQRWTYDLVANRLTGRTRYNLDFAVPLRRTSGRADVARLGRLYRTLITYQSSLGHPLNARLIFEHLFLSYLRCIQIQP
jgi:DNA polymerase-3 subunit delta'